MFFYRSVVCRVMSQFEFSPQKRPDSPISGVAGISQPWPFLIGNLIGSCWPPAREAINAFIAEIRTTTSWLLIPVPNKPWRRLLRSRRERRLPTIFMLLAVRIAATQRSFIQALLKLGSIEIPYRARCPAWVNRCHLRGTRIKQFARSIYSQGPPTGDEGDMKERLARLEEAVSGVKDRMTLMTVVIGFMLTILLALGAYSLNRMDRLEDKIDELPGKINASVQTLTQTLATAITATKQQQPQVILMPAPAMQSQKTAPKSPKPFSCKARAASPVLPSYQSAEPNGPCP